MKPAWLSSLGLCRGSKSLWQVAFLDLTILASVVAAAAPSVAEAGARGQAGAGGAAPVVDAHMHVWSDQRDRFPFAHPFDPKVKPPRVAGTVEMLVEEMDRSGITHCVLVQVIYHGWDNRYLAQCLKSHPKRFRGQGLIDPTDPQAA